MGTRSKNKVKRNLLQDAIDSTQMDKKVSAVEEVFLSDDDSNHMQKQVSAIEEVFLSEDEEMKEELVLAQNPFLSNNQNQQKIR